MLDLTNPKRIAIIGGGTAGWFAALTFRRLFSPAVEVTLIEAPEIPIIGVGEGGLINLVDGLIRNNIAIDDFIQSTGATYKFGFLYEGWRGGGREDVFYHLFGGANIPEFEWLQDGCFPLLSARIAAGLPLHSCIPFFEAIARHAPQAEMRELLLTGKYGRPASFHFDAHRVATFLRTTAQARGVVHRSARVEQFILDEQGYTRTLRLDGDMLEVDFVIDASGLARIGIDKTYHAPWCSFADFLLPDSAMPFHLPKAQENPALVTRSTSMRSGWMWQIPLQERVGGGYVFSSQHTDAATAQAEVEAYLGHRVEPKRVLRYNAGYFEKVWINNVMALGLASGFVEPLEATSIGLMLEQLRNLERLLANGGGIISGRAIDEFNTGISKSWTGIRDFLRLHYDCPRDDTPFWRDVAASPLPRDYAELWQCFQRRTPRMCDIEPYEGSGWQGIFYMINWIFVAAPLGVIPPAAALAELNRLPSADRIKVNAYLKQVMGG
ncbi:MAG: tryptophan 7-halogenase [Pseudomonadales bacterium]|jgi:tryptophan halogenase|nr:tryptophan 7-halogenase [Pseudomonadales bacterium]